MGRKREIMMRSCFTLFRTSVRKLNKPLNFIFNYAIREEYINIMISLALNIFFPPREKNERFGLA